MENNNKIILGIVIVAVIASSGFLTAFFIIQALNQPQETIDSRISGLLSQANVPSLSAGIIINDTLVWSKGYGDQPDGLDTVYMIGSVTKMFTATAIMQLYENNTLELDTDINNYIPFSVRNPNYPSTEITIRDLLSHTSGISKIDTPLWSFDADFLNWSNINLGTNYTIWDPRPTLGDFLNGTLNPAGTYYKPGTWENFAPGSNWQYSNLAYNLLAYIVEQVTNQTHKHFLQENVLDPLGMNSTGFNYTDFTGRNAFPYEQEDTGMVKGILYNLYDIGSGALRSTIPDLAKFLIAHMNQGTNDNSQILQPQTVNLMQTSQISMYGNELGGFYYTGYGLGWPLFTNSLIGHGGALPGYLNQIAFKTVNNGTYGIVFSFNKGSSIVQDDYLLDTFFPSMVNLLFEEAARLYSQ